MEKRTKINLGAGNIIEDSNEWFNHDLTNHRKEIEVTFDLNGLFWSWECNILGHINGLSPNYFTEIKAWDVIEHLEEPINFMNNCWDLLKEGGTLYLKACGYQNVSYYIDITHKKGYHINSFDYFDLSTDLGREYCYYTNKKWKILDKHYDRKQNVIVKLEKICN